MPLTKDAILAALPALSQPDLRAINATTAVLLAGGHPDSPQGPQGPQAWLLEALQATLGGTHSAAKWQTGPAGRQFAQSAAAVTAFVAKNFPDAMQTRTHGLALMRLLLSILVDDLKARGATITAGVLVSNLPRLPQVFEAAFPGYLSNGLVQVLMKRLMKSN